MKVPKVKLNMGRQRPDCYEKLIPIEDQSDYGLWAMMLEECDWSSNFIPLERGAAKEEWRRRFPNSAPDGHGVTDYYTSRWVEEAHRIAHAK